jgi:hypothetical protein
MMVMEEGTRRANKMVFSQGELHFRASMQICRYFG